MLCYLGNQHAILSALRDLIEAAEHSIVLQMYLFAANGDQTLLLPREGAFPYADTVAGWLVEKKQRRPQITIVVLLDTNTPANPQLTRRKGVLIRQRLQQAGVLVLSANLFDTEFDRRPRWLSAMNFHLHHQQVAESNWVEHQNRWQALHNVEDHRKNLIIDGGRAGLLTSHNLFDPAFDWHENMLWLSGKVAKQLWQQAMVAIRAALLLPQPLTETDRGLLSGLVADSVEPAYAAPQEPIFPSGRPIPNYPLPLPPVQPELIADPDCALLETRAIRGRIETLIGTAANGDELLLATAYFSDLPMLSALHSALSRGVRVRVLIDSLHALPLPTLPSWLTCSLVNHAVLCEAQSLQQRYPDLFQLRIHQSHAGAMMHLKSVARLGQRPLLIAGQANFTPNSFSGAYLETDIETHASVVIAAYAAHFEQLWSLPESKPLLTPRGMLALLRIWLCSLLLWLFARAGLRP